MEDIIGRSSEFLRAAGLGPLPFIVAVLLIITITILRLRTERLGKILTNLEKLPEGQRLAALQEEMGSIGIPQGVSADHWLSARRDKYRFWLKISLGALCIVALFFVAIVLIYRLTPAHAKTDPKAAFIKQQEIVRARLIQGDDLYEKNEISEARVAYQDTKRMAEATRDPNDSSQYLHRWVAAALDGLARCETIEDRPGEAMKLLGKAEEELIHVGNPLLRGQNLLTQANTAVTLKDFPRARQLYERSRDYLVGPFPEASEESKRKTLMLYVQIGLDRLELESDNSGRSADALTKSLQTDRKRGILEGVPERLQNLAVACYKKGWLEKARAAAVEAKIINSQPGGNELNLATNLELIAAVDSELNQLESSQAACIDAIRLSRKGGRITLAIDCFEIWANLLLRYHKWDSALKVVIVIESTAKSVAPSILTEDEVWIDLKTKMIKHFSQLHYQKVAAQLKNLTWKNLAAEITAKQAISY